MCSGQFDSYSNPCIQKGTDNFKLIETKKYLIFVFQKISPEREYNKLGLVELQRVFSNRI